MSTPKKHICKQHREKESSGVQADFFVSSLALSFIPSFDQIFSPIAIIPLLLLDDLLSDICILAPHFSEECGFHE